MTRLKHILATAGLLFCCFATYAQTISNKGKEFWVGYGHHQFMEQGTNTQNMVLYLSTEEQGAVVTVTIDSSGNPFLPVGSGGLWTKTYTLPPFTVVQSAIIPKGTTNAPTPADANYDARLYDIAPPVGNGGAGIFRKRAIHIVSTAPIVAYAHIYGSASSGATMLMPVTAWGYSYMTLNSKQDYANNCYNWMYVIASKDNTVIEINTPVKTRAQDKTGLQPGVTKQVTLMKGQVYQVIGANTGADANGNGGSASTGLDLSGTTVKSVGGSLGNCYPIAVFAGSSRTANPASCGSGGGDNDNQQVFPFHAWGKTYATVPFSNSTTPTNYTTNTFKIGVMDPTTVVKRNGAVLTGLISNKYYSYESSSPDYIEADKPIMVSQFMTGGGCLGTPGGLGDPEMVVVAPIEQAIKQVGFYRNSREGISVNYVTLVLKQEGLPSLRIDNSFTFDAVIDHPRLPGYKIVIKKWNISAGQGYQCFIKCDSAFNAITYGEGSVESYAYSAGAYINNLNSRAGLHNIPDTANGGNKIHEYTCVNTPIKLSILMRYRTLKLNWDVNLAGLPNGCWRSEPNFSGQFLMDPAENYLVDTNVVINGIKYYKYELPFTFYFSCPGLYDIPVTSTSPGIDNCGNNEYLTTSIEVKAAPVINFTISHPTKCTKDSITLTGPTAGLSGGTTPMFLSQYTWSFPNGVTGKSKDTVIVLPPGVNQEIKLKAITDQGCLSDSVTKTVTVYSPPTTVLSATPDTVCLGQNIVFKQTASYGDPSIAINNYYWDFGDAVTTNSTPPTDTQTHGYSTYNTYTAKGVTRLSGLCIGDTSYKVIYVGAKAKVGFTYPTTCLPPSGLAQFVANATAQGGATITSYSWNFGDPASGGNNTATGQSVSHIYAPTADSFKVTLSVVTSTGCSGDTSIWVNANIAPQLGWSASSNFNAVCEDTAPFSLAYGTVLNNIQGTPKYTGPGIDSAGLFNPSAAGPGTHTIRFNFKSTKGCTEFKDTTITVKPKPSKPAVIIPSPYCQNAAAVVLSATGDLGSTLTWYDNAALTGGVATITPSTSNSGTFTYYVTQTVASCTSNPETVTVTVQPSITGNLVSSSQTICSTTAASQLVSAATLVGGTGSYTYQWQSSPNGTNWSDISGATNASYAPGSLTTTTYYRRNVISGACSNISNTDTITVFAAITNNTILDNQVICEGKPAAQINGTAGATGYTYQWISSANASGPWSAVATATGQNYTPGALTATTFFKRVVVNGACTDTSAAVSITVNPQANGSISAVTGICQYDYAKVRFDATAGTASFTVYLTITNPSNVSAQIQQSVASGDSILVIPTNSATGTYTVKLDSIRNSNGCVNTTGGTPIQIIVTAVPNIIITPTPSAIICEGTVVTLTASGASTYTWTGASLTSTSGSTVTATPTTSGSYTVEGAIGTCKATQSIGITVNPRPAKPVVGTPVPYCQGSFASPLTAAALPGDTLKWFTDNTLTNGSTTTPTPSTATAGTFYFYVNQTNAGGCVSDTSTITVIVQPSIAGNTITADQTICSGSSAASIGSAAAPTGGDGTNNYSWELSTNNGTSWTAISGANGISYNPGNLLVTTQFRRIVSSGLCSNVSLPVTITVVPAITNNIISGDQAICEGNPATVITGSTAVSGSNYQWISSTNNGVTWTTISGANTKDYLPVVTVTTQFKRIINNGPCTDTSALVTVTVNPLANGSISGPTAICQYDYAKVKFVASAGTASFIVYLSVTNPSNTKTPIQQTVASGDSILVIPINSAGGTYTVRIDSIRNSNGCINVSGFTPLTINVTATPTVVLNPVTDICEGKTSSLSVSGATDYIWSTSNTAINFSGTTGSAVTAAPTSAGTYTFQVQGSTNGCLATPVNGSLTVNPKPNKPSVGPPVTYCQLGPATPLQATASGSNILKWYDNPGLTGGVTTAPTPSTATAGNILYYVTQTNSFGCESDTAITTIIVNPGITGNVISGGETICQGSTPATPLLGTGSITGGNGSYTYQWQRSIDNGTNWSNIPGATNADYSPGVLNTTTQYRRLVNSSLCGSISNVITETVFTGLANYDITGTYPPICEASAPAMIDAQTTTGSGTLTYTWQSSPDNVSWTDIASSNFEDYQPPALTTTTWYRRKVTNGPCTAFSSAVEIVVKPLPNGTIAASPSAICEYESADIIFTSTAATPPFDVILSITNPAGITSTKPMNGVNSGASLNVIPANSAAGDYSIVITSITSNGCTQTTGFTSVPVKVKPTPVVVANDVTICEGVSATLMATGADTYTWNGTSLLANSGASVTANPSSNTTYTVTGTTNGCNSVPKSVNVIVNPRPVVTINASKTELCLNDNVTFTVTSSIASGTIASYSWDFDNGNTFTGANPPVQSYSTHRTYNTKLFAVSDKNCTSLTDTKAITVNPLPLASFTPPAFVCLPNNTATFQNTSTIPNGAALNYFWNFGDAASGSSNTSTATDGVHIYPDSNKYTVTLNVVSAQGCTAQATNNFDAFFRKPVAKFGVTPDTLCQGIKNEFTDESFASGSNIDRRTWSFGDGTTLTNVANPTKIYSLPGNYTITLSVKNTQGCSAEVSKNVVVYLQPVIDAGASHVVPQGTTVTFNATANSNALQFAWTNNAGVSVSNPTILRPTYQANQDAKFILTATGQGNCQAFDSITVKVLRPIVIPNAFSPNGDNINDKWEIKNLQDYPNCVIEVFNRYGQAVYRSFGYKLPWDGSYKGTPLPVGTYYYIIEPKNGFPTVTGYVVIVK